MTPTRGAFLLLPEQCVSETTECRFYVTSVDRKAGRVALSLNRQDALRVFPDGKADRLADWFSQAGFRVDLEFEPPPAGAGTEET